MSTNPKAQIKGFMTLIGYIDASFKTTVRLGYVTDSEDPRQSKLLDEADQPPVLATQLDANQSVLDENFPVPTNTVHADPTDNEYAMFLGKMPLQTQTRYVTLYWQGNLVATLDIPDNPPTIEVTWQPQATVDGQQEVTWAAKHPDGLPMEFTVFYSHDAGKSFQKISQSISATTFPVDFSQLPGGTGVIKVMATDGGNTVSALSAPFSSPIKPVYTMVFSPPTNTQVKARLVTLQGQGYYLEEDAAETKDLVWTSSVDGVIGHGAVVQTQLSQGKHTITLNAGKGDRLGASSIVVDAV